MSGRCSSRSEGRPVDDALRHDAVEAAAAHRQAGGRLAEQHRERRDVLAQDLIERRNGGALLREQRLLLRDIEAGRGADRDTVLIHTEDARRRAHVVVGDADAVLRGENLEIRVDDARDGGEDDDLAVETARDRGELGGAQRRAVLAPQVDLVARVEDRAEVVDARRHAGAGARCGSVEGEHRQERRARDAGRRIGLLDSSNRRRDIEIVEMRAFDQIGQFARAEAAPPVGRRQRRALAVAGAIGRRHVDRAGGVGHLGRQQAAREQRHRQQHKRNAAPGSHFPRERSDLLHRVTLPRHIASSCHRHATTHRARTVSASSPVGGAPGRRA